MTGKPIASRVHTTGGTFLVEGAHAEVSQRVGQAKQSESVRFVRMVGTGFASDWPIPGLPIHIEKRAIVAVEGW